MIDEVFSISYSNHEPHHLVQYLFVLCNTASKALKVLQVKTAPDTTTAMVRLLLFHCMYEEDS
jgi:arginyl-tRNA synthetase